MARRGPPISRVMAQEHKVLVTCPMFLQVIDDYREQCEERGVSLVTPAVEQHLSEDALVTLVGDVHGVVAGDDPFTERVIAAAPKLKVLIKWGVGIDAIDVAALDRRGIPFSNTPRAFGDEVADVAMGYVVMLARQLHVIDREVRKGHWAKPPGVSLRGKTAGIIGFGNIGQAVAQRAKAFGMVALTSDIDDDLKSVAVESGVGWGDLDDVLSTADFLILCCSLLPQNHHLIDATRLGRMKPGGYLINVARGPLVDEEALVQALEQGRLAGSAQDVFEEEPLAADHKLRAFPQCIFGSHNGANTREAVHRVNLIALDKLYRGLNGGQVG